MSSRTAHELSIATKPNLGRFQGVHNPARREAAFISAEVASMQLVLETGDDEFILGIGGPP